jgi:trehalose synthase
VIELVTVDEPMRLADYDAHANLVGALRELRAEAAALVPRLAGRTVWMVSSTAQGGGVAEMLPKVTSLLDELGVTCRWAVLRPTRPEFFALTKRIHNLIHGHGDPDLGPADRDLYETVNRGCADALRPHLGPADLVVVHDPQPLPLGAFLKADLGVTTVWRSHIGVDVPSPAAAAAWSLLRPFAATYDRAVFSAPEYIPEFLAGRARIIHPAIDPQSHKNRELSPHKLVGILCNAALQHEAHPVLTPPFAHLARRLGPDGRFALRADEDEIGLLYRPIVTQISRWDHLKGFGPLLAGFARLKRRREEHHRGWSERLRRRVAIVRLVLAGPDPGSIADDPEGLEVVTHLVAAYRGLAAAHQADVAILSLPMASRKENALMVNALQRCSTIVAQNSLREGFGLTVTEGMWKRVPVLGSRACGLRQQVRDGVDGLLVPDPEDPDGIADALERLLGDDVARDAMGRAAQRRVHDEFLVFAQVRAWLRLLADCPRPAAQA